MNGDVKQMLQLHPCFHGPRLSCPLLHLLPLPPPWCLSIVLRVIFYPLFFYSFAFQWTHCCKLRSFILSSKNPVSLMTIRSVIFRASGASTNSFAALSTWGPLAGCILGVFAKVICQWFFNADVTQNLGMTREKIKNKGSSLSLLFSPPFKKRPHVWQIKMTRTRLARDFNLIRLTS